MAILSWGGWEVDVEGRRLVLPREVVFGLTEVTVLAALIENRGNVVSRRSLGEAIVAAGSITQNPENRVGMAVFAINAKAWPKGEVVNVRRFGYRLSPATILSDPGADGRRARVVELLKDQFEATGPHARSVAAAIELIYGGERILG